ncbi:Cof-type HAD-IIB family hydrolase [Proteiniclasticum sp.]|uniref:Cof-type HAD-IIB family hydrolase n=1 Tax=Proteiniclasticum sp. TaxID=2053595 RepID=UPI00289FD0AB|nr:Cof-type HAD-IIB family hydrolase [Proteiniclasticum sp.]
MIRLVAIDMDGTLLSSEHKVSPLNRKALKLADEKGIKVVLCSGRRIHNLLDYAKELGIDGNEGFVVGNNGAGAMRIADSKVIYENYLTAAEAQSIAEVCDSVDANYTVHTFDAAISPRENLYSKYEAGLNGIDLTIMHPSALADETMVTNMLVLDEVETLNGYEKVIMDTFSEKYRIIRTMPMYLEIMKKEVTKFNGIMAVADLFGIRDDEIMSIGDAANDLEMIVHAGVGVAMGNAQKVIKDAADYITLRNDEDGVAYAMNRFLKLDMIEFKHEEVE